MTLSSYTERMESIKALSDADARKEFRRLSGKLHGTLTATAIQLGVQKVTVTKWLADTGRPSNLALFALQLIEENELLREYVRADQAKRDLAHIIGRV